MCFVLHSPGRGVCEVIGAEHTHFQHPSERLKMCSQQINNYFNLASRQTFETSTKSIVEDSCEEALLSAKEKTTHTADDAAVRSISMVTVNIVCQSEQAKKPKVFLVQWYHQTQN